MTNRDTGKGMSNVPVANWAAKVIRTITFRGSSDYWESRYASGGNSGSGSYGPLAAFKADTINQFVLDHQVQSVIEFGCGDGNQLSLLKVPSYIGLDISRTILKSCIARYSGDSTKSFFLYDCDAFVDRDRVVSADAAMSLDVLYHLVEDRVFQTYLSHLFNSAKRFVIIYASNFESGTHSPHVRHRKFTAMVDQQFTDWKLHSHIPNPHPYDTNNADATSFADFYIYAKR